MDYVNGNGIRKLRERLGMTQKELAAQIGVSDKAVSKWETGRGLPDVSILGDLAESLGVSLPELFAGIKTVNRNRGGSMLRSGFYVCPVCGNVIHSLGDATISCCGVSLPRLEAEEADDEHHLLVEMIEDEYYITLDHPMTREHHISFIAYMNWERLQLVKLYPEQDAAARFARCGKGTIFAYCNKHGLYAVKL